MHGLLYLSDMDIRSQGSKKVNKPVLFIRIKMQVHTVYFLLGTSWETVTVGANNNKNVLSVDSTFSGLDKSF